MGIGARNRTVLFSAAVTMVIVLSCMNGMTAAVAKTKPSWAQGSELTRRNVIDILGHAPKKLIRSLPLSKPKKVEIDAANGSLTLTYKITNALKETDMLDIGGQTSYGVHRALFLNPTVQRSTVIMTARWIDEYGKGSTEKTLVSTLTRPTEERIGWSGLEDRVYIDNKWLYCLSDERYVHPAIYVRLKDPGCLKL